MILLTSALIPFSVNCSSPFLIGKSIKLGLEITVDVLGGLTLYRPVVLEDTRLTFNPQVAVLISA